MRTTRQPAEMAVSTRVGCASPRPRSHFGHGSPTASRLPQRCFAPHHNGAMSVETHNRHTTAPALAEYLGVTTKTVRAWIRAGVLTAWQVQTRHYTDERTRKTKRGTWRIAEPDLLDFLSRFRAAGRATKAGGLPSWLLSGR